MGQVLVVRAGLRLMGASLFLAERLDCPGFEAVASASNIEIDQSPVQLNRRYGQAYGLPPNGEANRQIAFLFRKAYR